MPKFFRRDLEFRGISKSINYQRNSTTNIYLVYSLDLIYNSFREKLFNKNNNKNIERFNGIYIFTNRTKKSFSNNLADIEKIEYISYHILEIIYRLKRKNIKKSFKSFYTLPFLDTLQSRLRYLLSMIDLIKKSFNFDNDVINLYLKSNGDLVINKCLKKYIKKRYNINLIFISFGWTIKPSDNIFFSYKDLNLISIFSIFKYIPLRKKKDISKFENKKLLVINHPLNKLNIPYNYYLENKTIKDKSYLTNFHDISSYGLNKFESFIYGTKKIISIDIIHFRNIFRIIRYKLFLDYLQIFLNLIYIKNISILFQKINIKNLFCSYISFSHEKLIYRACKLNNIKSIQYDFSLGYPTRHKYFKREISLLRNPDIVIVGSYCRLQQYKIAMRNYLQEESKIKFINLRCPTIDYAIKKSRTLNFNELSELKKNNNYKIVSIFDNLYGDNTSIKVSYIENLVSALNESSKNIFCISHSKNRYNILENNLKKCKIKNKRSIQGDFSLASYSDLIISVGFQGAAIKASVAFKKPLVFFTSDHKYYENLIFSDQRLLNKKIKSNFEKLIFKSRDFKILFNESSLVNIKLKELEIITSQFIAFLEIPNEEFSLIDFLINFKN